MTLNSAFFKPEITTVMILAAGEGRRMLPLTQETPKPLLKVGDYSLLEHHLLNLSSLGFNKIIINTAYLASKIQQTIGDGSQYNLNISYSDESNTGALETAGGIINALPLIESKQFVVVNADIWTDFNFTTLLKPLNKSHLGRLVLVENPKHNQLGDFILENEEHLYLKDTSKKTIDEKTVTFSGIALYQKPIFENLEPGKRALAPILRELISNSQLDCKMHAGRWTDVGTPERLENINLEYTTSLQKQ